MQTAPTGLSPRGRLVLVATELVVGFGAIYGGYGLLTDAEGLGAEESWLEGSPFADYTVPGVVLLVVIGGGLLTAAVLAALGHRLAPGAALVMGVALLTWGVVETVTVGWQGPPQVALLAAFVVAPAAILIGVGRTALRALSSSPGGSPTAG
jgi:asparagine N-glycosylation enzyme membrane subunit Stt3